MAEGAVVGQGSGWLRTAELRGFEQAASTAIALSAGVVLLCLGFAIVLGPQGERLATLIAIYGVCVLGLSAYSGNTGIISFGHAGFVGFGAYLSGILTMPAVLQRTALPALPGWLAGHELGLVASLLVVAASAGVLGLVTGWPINRLRGSSASIASLGFLIIAYSILSGARDFTRGNQTFYGVPRFTTLAVALTVFVVAIIVACWFKESRQGLFSRALRDNEAGAVACGVDPLTPRLTAWVVSAMLCVVGGALFGHFLGAFSPRTFYFDLTFFLVAMAILGGLFGVTGAVVGVFGVSILIEVLRIFETGVTIGPITTPALLGIGQLGVGLGILVMLLVRPRGLFGWSEIGIPLPRFVRRRATASAPVVHANAALDLRSVSKRYDGIVAVDDITCRIDGGRITGLIGPNGAGKTTLVNLITGHVTPTTGRIGLGETAFGRLDAAAIARLGVARTFQNIRIFDRLSVGENVVVAALATGVPRAEAFALAERELAALDLGSAFDQAAGSLSYGPRRRLEIARALAMRPRLLLLDEPAAGMNPAETEDLRERLERIAAQRGLAILLIDHDLPFVMSLSTDIIVLDRGRIIATGSPDKVRADPAVIEAYIGGEVAHAA
ncbi:MAG: ATP-binding cassette domain-containing protein [Labrys sp. (in: a-proteobacteria)]